MPLFYVKNQPAEKFVKRELLTARLLSEALIRFYCIAVLLGESKRDGELSSDIRILYTQAQRQ